MKRKHLTIQATILLVLKYFSLIFFGFVAVIPVVSCVITAFKTSEEYQSPNVMTLPESWLNFDNFIKAYQAAN
ncbi:MAG: carbohydrate ABC transporter permease, partial [Pseudobutyrivibrio sp.]|nr:carbohydrate ABC transporter permease [Pseudobutyrivibrio sp.]